MIEKLESKRNTVHIWASKDGTITVNDRLTGINNLSGVMSEKIVSNPKLTVSLKSDEYASMELISEIHTQLRLANALKLSYTAKMETAEK